MIDNISYLPLYFGQFTAKVCDYVCCHECNHRRCIYSNKVLTTAEKSLLQVAKEILYSCGMQFATSGLLSEIVTVREGISCQSPMEAQYYSATLAKFPDVCYQCGKDEPLHESPEIAELKQQFAVVRPICTFCVQKGEQPKTSHPKVVKRKK